MGRNVKKDSIEMAAKNQRILEEGFRLFSGKGIENVAMTDVARAAGIGVASLYRYYSTKPELVLGIATWAWEGYVKEQIGKLKTTDLTKRSGRAGVSFYLEAYLDLYRNHKNLLRYNQFFNVYVQSVSVAGEGLTSYRNMIAALEKRFAGIYEKGMEDGTLNRGFSESEMFSTLTHLMLAAVTRYAVGLVYNNQEAAAEKELQTLKECLMSRFCATAPAAGGKENESL